MQKRWFSFLAVVFLAVALAACSSDKPAGDPASSDATPSSEKAADAKIEKKEKGKKADTKPDDLLCPQVAIVRALDEYKDFGGEKPDPSELIAGGRMDSVSGDCFYSDNAIDINFLLSLAAQRGSRVGEHISLPYFVAVLDPAGRIINKQRLTADIKFVEANKIATQDEALHIVIPLDEKNWLSGKDYRVLIGFQVTQ